MPAHCPFCIYTQTLYPFIHIGPLTIGTFGLLMWAAFVAAFFALQAEIKRRKLSLDASVIILSMAIAGIIGAKIWHVIDTPDDRLTLAMLRQPVFLPDSLTHIAWLRALSVFLVNFFSWFRQGFAWFGGFVAGITTLLLLARRYRISMLTMLDICSPAAAIGYGVGRLGCLISGDGDYGKPTSCRGPGAWPFLTACFPQRRSARNTVGPRIAASIPLLFMNSSPEC